MRKILLTLLIAFSFSSAIAEKSTGFDFLGSKPTTLNYLLDKVGAQTNSNYQCEQTCWDNRNICIGSGQPFTACIQDLMQCVDTCEGAGGLYQ